MGIGHLAGLLSSLAGDHRQISLDVGHDLIDMTDGNLLDIELLGVCVALHESVWEREAG